MRMCTPHWAALREGIKDRGMWHLVATSGAEATEQINAELAGHADPQRFDPLMSANFAIWTAGLECGGLAMLSGEAICPLCEAEKHEVGMAANWIEGCLDAQLEHARELKLVPGVQ